MSDLVALKGVRKEVWQQFKSESAKHGMPMGAFFEKLMNEHEHSEKENRSRWKRILEKKPLLTKKEADNIETTMKEFREGFDFREIP